MQVKQKSKLSNIITGWANVIFENEDIEAMAKKKAMVCSTCINAEWSLIASLVNDRIEEIKGLKCGLCGCPIGALIRSNEICKANKW